MKIGKKNDIIDHSDLWLALKRKKEIDNQKPQRLFNKIFTKLIKRIFNNG